MEEIEKSKGEFLKRTGIDTDIQCLFCGRYLIPKEGTLFLYCKECIDKVKSGTKDKYRCLECNKDFKNSLEMRDCMLAGHKMEWIEQSPEGCPVLQDEVVGKPEDDPVKYHVRESER